MRAVLDCNVIVSGLIRQGSPPARILDALMEGRVEAVFSPMILEEYRRTLRYPKLRRCLALSSEGIESLLTGMALSAFWVEDHSSGGAIVREDPSDDIYLLAAAESRADFVVSDDRHLLGLGEYEAIPIVSPRVFIQKAR